VVLGIFCPPSVRNEDWKVIQLLSAGDKISSDQLCWLFAFADNYPNNFGPETG
jgi:hypothetical protein